MTRRGSPDSVSGFSWTPENVALLRELWLTGVKMTTICMKLGGVTRNVVIGKVHRLKLVRGNPTAPSVTPAPVRSKSGLTPPALRKPQPPTFPPEPASPPTGNAPVAFIDLRDRHCRWPVETDAGRMYCGARRCGDRTLYCAYHHSISYVPAGRGGRVAEKTLLRHAGATAS